MDKTALETMIFVAENRDASKSTFDHLAEEVMELHLSMRGKHPDTPAMEWLEIATLAMVAFDMLPECDRALAFQDWKCRHKADESDPKALAQRRR